jgi:hypothetical protein
MCCWGRLGAAAQTEISETSPINSIEQHFLWPIFFNKHRAVYEICVIPFAGAKKKVEQPNLSPDQPTEGDDEHRKPDKPDYNARTIGAQG